MRNRVWYAVLLMFLFVACVGCESGLIPKEYVSFIESAESGCSKETDIANWHYRLLYKPGPYIFCQENKGQAMKKADLAQREKSMHGWVFFNLYIKDLEQKGRSPLYAISSNLDDYNVKYNYLLLNNKDNFSLIYDGQQIKPVIYSYENNYNLSPEDVYVLGFRLPASSELTSDIIFEYNDVLLKNGIMRFVFDKDDLNDLPNLSLKSANAS